MPTQAEYSEFAGDRNVRKDTVSGTPTTLTTHLLYLDCTISNIHNGHYSSRSDKASDLPLPDIIAFSCSTPSHHQTMAIAVGTLLGALFLSKAIVGYRSIMLDSINIT